MNATTFAKIADASQPGQGGVTGFVKSMSEGIVMPRDLRSRGFRPQNSRFDDAGETKASIERLIVRKPDCDFQPVREHAIERGERSDAPNPYKLALGLLKHPNRQLSGAGDRGRSVNKRRIIWQSTGTRRCRCSRRGARDLEVCSSSVRYSKASCSRDTHHLGKM